MSEQQEIAQGAEADPQVIAQFGLYDNQALQNFIDTRGQEMVKISHRPGLKFTFRIVDSPVVNAFAVPGGYVYFTRGIMAYFNNEAEFAGVLGHETGHITARHGVEQYTKSTLANVLLIGGMVVSPEFAKFGDAAQSAMSLLFLKYSRDDESQADQLGVEYSTKVGYDAHQMADFFKTLKSLSEGSGDELPTFLSTHPDPADRFNKVDKAATEWQVKEPQAKFKVNRDSYLKMVDGIIFGEDPRQGFVENGIFYHPELKFQFPVPNNWQLQNSPAQVQMAPSNGKALMIFTLSQGSSLQAAAQANATELQLTVASSNPLTINGLQALEVMSSQTSQDPNTGATSSIKVQSIYIQYKSNIYVFHGVSLPTDFQGYASDFTKTMRGFKELTDQSKINAKPDRIKVVPVKNSGTLAQALQGYSVPSTRIKEFAIVNGMEQNEQVTAGTLIKVVTK
ncbi:MAG TPA: M48 family metalloprotease [Saprospiraceae bacterium]|nr:M48 family metalloprotease [Saprospiraceae bacterium]